MPNISTDIGMPRIYLDTPPQLAANSSAPCYNNMRSVKLRRNNCHHIILRTWSLDTLIVNASRCTYSFVYYLHIRSTIHPIPRSICMLIPSFICAVLPERKIEHNHSLYFIRRWGGISALGLCACCTVFSLSDAILYGYVDRGSSDDENNTVLKHLCLFDNLVTFWCSANADNR